ncbi:MAG: hypothetical protein VX344_06620 [Bacteroidota bacterium]|nr:hypothetical protein [Bacteroidota bacterium]
MFRALTILLVLTTIVTNAQTFKVSSNVISTSLYEPFAPVGGYTIAFERILDPGYSLNLAQFSYKLGLTMISDTKKGKIATIGDAVFYDEDAFRYSGFLIVPEIKYYFTWDAPMGVYINVFGSYSDYLETYTDEKVDSFDDYDKKYNTLGRGLGAGFQFNIYKNLTLDIVGGYNISNVSSKTKPIGEDEFIENPDIKEDGLYLNAFLGLNF